MQKTKRRPSAPVLMSAAALVCGLVPQAFAGASPPIGNWGDPVSAAAFNAKNEKAGKSGYEVWVSDQANTQGITAATPNGTHGGVVRIYRGQDLDQAPPVDNAQLLDVTTDLFPAANSTTGAHVARIHGILPSPDHRYMALNFVASGHLGLVDGATKKPVCLFRSTGTPTGRQNHMSFWSPDGSSLIVANQNGRFVERVNVIRNHQGALAAFVFDAEASLDLVGGNGRVTAQPVAVDSDPNDGIGCSVKGSVLDGQSTTTPNGKPKQDSVLRPLNSVICPIAAKNGRHVFVTLGGGGLFVVDIRATPLAIVAEYDTSVVSASGCGGVEGANFMHINSGTSGPGVSQFSVYRFPLHYPSAPGYLPPNTPDPRAVYVDPDDGKIAGQDLPPGTNRDAHGLVLVNKGNDVGHYLHQFDRIRNNVEVFKLVPPWDQFRKEGTYHLTDTEVCGTTLGAKQSNDPTPDLADLIPLGPWSGRRIVVALRGPFPLTISHAADGSCPGLGLLTLAPNGKSGTLTHVLPTTVLNADGTRNLSDPHAAIVRRTGR